MTRLPWPCAPQQCKMKSSMRLSFIGLFCLLEAKSHHVDQANMELAEIPLPLPPECWDEKCVPPLPGSWGYFFLGLFDRSHPPQPSAHPKDGFSPTEPSPVGPNASL